MVSNWYVGIGYVLIAVVISIISLVMVRRRFGPETLRKHNEVSAPIHAAVGVVYAVLLAFVVMEVYEQYNTVDGAVMTEAEHIVALDRDVEALPDSIHKELHDALLRYTQSVVDDEWKLMQKGSFDRYHNTYYLDLWQRFKTVVPNNPGENVWFATALQRLNNVDEARSQRWRAAEDRIPGVMWILLISGGLITVIFAGFFGSESKGLHIFMISCLAALLAFTLFLIASLDRAFVGVAALEPEPFIHALRILNGKQ